MQSVLIFGIVFESTERKAKKAGHEKKKVSTEMQKSGTEDFQSDILSKF